jgi:hypothetical protein
MSCAERVALSVCVVALCAGGVASMYDKRIRLAKEFCAISAKVEKRGPLTKMNAHYDGTCSGLNPDGTENKWSPDWRAIGIATQAFEGPAPQSAK